jgi:hypothetical protein
MRVIQTCNRQVAHKARLAQFRNVISTFESEGSTVTGMVHSITEQRLDEGVQWTITIRRKTEQVVIGRRRYSPPHL